MSKVIYDKLKPLTIKRELAPVMLTDETIKERVAKVIENMEEQNLDALVIYGDLEHGSSFEYLTGFVTRFEEGMLVLHRNQEAFLLLGNENINKASKSRIPAKGIHMPQLSLPNQPMENDGQISLYFENAGLKEGLKVGVVGWKLFTSKVGQNNTYFDVSSFLIDALKEVVGSKNLSNQTELLIGSRFGARVTNNANEIAHYEFWSQLASQGIMSALDIIKVGISEMELAHVMQDYGQPRSVVTIAATGERFELGNIYPTRKEVALGDAMSLTVGYKGGLSSRAGYAAFEKEDLPVEQQDYLEVLAKPYYKAICTWLETIKVGMVGAELYEKIEEVFPKEVYNWSLNPGHLFSDEEWLSSPVYPESRTILESGMMFQTDIIPSKAGYAGTSCESGIALADEELRAEIKEKYPELYQVFMERRRYMREELGIKLSEDVLPMTDTVAFYRPFFLNKEKALKINY
ncbi:M24 family metallopeptidase [Vagococcus jeotgali]|uniref:M24 family metallopeptidase n=1 Tax=Vagococcus jeotgali TaxID=3109030 RepID=UPI002DD94F70|nr:aminopeptidase P family N-terminal domain-containing protein [Vagococcus sp. B2T-5]